MKSSDNVGITTVNVVLGQGCYNNIVNVTLGAYEFNPKGDGTVDPSATITARLRMDIACAEELVKSLGKFLKDLREQQASEVAEGLNGSGKETDRKLDA